MNLPNSLTVLRILLVPFFVVILLVRIPHGDLLAAAIFGIAALTDTLDGYLARKWRQVTRLGILLDPIADKLLITAALISLVEMGKIPGWPAIVIIARELAITGMRAVKAEEGIVVPASSLGKLKTVSQVAAVLIIILEEHLIPFVAFPIGLWMLYFAVLITLLSGIDYFKKSW